MPISKVDLLGGAARYDICRGCGTHTSRIRDDVGRWIYPAVRPDGRRVSLLKVLQTNYCEKDCGYCVNRSGRDSPRASFSPDELARLFDDLARRGRVEGLFLSSGLWGGAGRAMERMLATVELLRRHYHFGGYVHLKILPGADEDCILQALRMADRVSVNLEAPNSRRIGALSKSKNFREELLGPLFAAHRLRQTIGKPVSMTTQFVVGATDETDHELLDSAAWLYKNLQLSRTYYSAFQPVADTPLENRPATPTWREHRLYQADFLLRDYGFRANEIIFDAGENLSREADPKMIWARNHPEQFPIEVNTATRRQLLRIPGVGPRSADAILQRRRQGSLRDMRHLGMSKGLARRAASFVLLNGRRPTHQLPLWEWAPARGNMAAAG